jgi:ABC-type dipeptide/oligopeptide/nickel transport system permease component
MLQQIRRRLLASLLTLIGIITIVFLLVRLIPGDPAEVMLGDYGTEEEVAALRHDLGLDRPLYVQYIKFLIAIARGNLGYSTRSHRLVIEEMKRVLPYTILLTLMGVLISILVGIPFGIIGAYKRNSLIDYLSMTLALLGYSAPSFWLAILLLIVFSIRLDWFPTLGGGDLADLPSLAHHLVLPALSLGLRHAGLVARITRSSMLEVLAEDYVRTARAKGLAEGVVLYRHTLKNASIPIVTVVGLNIGALLGGSVATEIVFTRPGMGRLLVEAILARDYPIIQGVVLVWALIFILVNLIVDLTYTYLDPRVKYK